jgi:hypothetical protein
MKKEVACHKQVNQSGPVPLYIQSVLDMRSFLGYLVLARVAAAATEEEHASGRTLSSLISLRRSSPGHWRPEAASRQS